jgi:site-specific recombinase XerD
MEECEEASNFDKCLDYEKFVEVVTELFNKVIELREQGERKKTLEVWSSYLALTIIMLANGLRIKEALRAVTKFYETNERVVTIKAEKGGDPRIVVIPEFIEREDVEYVYKETVRYGEKRIKERVEHWLQNVFKVNPHSIRYAFIRHLTLKGKPLEAVARALGLRQKRVIKEYYLRGLQLEEEVGEGGGVERDSEGSNGVG